MRTWQGAMCQARYAAVRLTDVFGIALPATSASSEASCGSIPSRAVTSWDSVASSFSHFVRRSTVGGSSFTFRTLRIVHSLRDRKSRAVDILLDRDVFFGLFIRKSAVGSCVFAFRTLNVVYSVRYWRGRIANFLRGQRKLQLYRMALACEILDLPSQCDDLPVPAGISSVYRWELLSQRERTRPKITICTQTYLSDVAYVLSDPLSPKSDAYISISRVLVELRLQPLREQLGPRARTYQDLTTPA